MKDCLTSRGIFCLFSKNSCKGQTVSISVLVLSSKRSSFRTSHCGHHRRRLCQESCTLRRIFWKIHLTGNVCLLAFFRSSHLAFFLPVLILDQCSSLPAQKLASQLQIASYFAVIVRLFVASLWKSLRHGKKWQELVIVRIFCSSAGLSLIAHPEYFFTSFHNKTLYPRNCFYLGLEISDRFLTDNDF